MHDNALSEGTRKGWKARLERQSQINVEMSSLIIHINFYKHNN